MRVRLDETSASRVDRAELTKLIFEVVCFRERHTVSEFYSTNFTYRFLSSSITR